MPGLIGPQTEIGLRRHRVTLENPTTRVPDPEGGYIYEWGPCDPPAVWAKVEPASAQRLTELVAGTLITTATHVVTLPFHPQVQITTRLTYQSATGSHQLYVIHAPINIEDRDVELQLVCSEVVGGSVPALMQALNEPPALTPFTVGGTDAG